MMVSVVSFQQSKLQVKRAAKVANRMGRELKEIWANLVVELEAALEMQLER